MTIRAIRGRVVRRADNGKEYKKLGINCRDEVAVYLSISIFSNQKVTTIYRKKQLRSQDKADRYA